MTYRSRCSPGGVLRGVIVVWASLLGLVTADCVKINSCSCDDKAAGGVIDLSPLDGGSTPKFNHERAPDKYFYSWNPCSSFSETSGCSSVSGCQMTGDLQTGYPIGTQDSAKFSGSISTGDLKIDYQAQDGSGFIRQLRVHLFCDPKERTGKATPQGETSSSLYEIELRSIHCCPGGHSEGGTVSVSVSAGTVITIVFFALVFLYVVVGLVVQKFGRKASGREVFPNVTFWMAAPGLVKDGFRFTFTCGRKRSYDKI